MLLPRTKKEHQVLDSGLISGEVGVDEYAAEILRQHSLEHALKEIQTLKEENAQLKAKLARSAGDFTDQVFMDLKRERDELAARVSALVREPESKRRQFPAVAALMESRANAMGALRPLSRLFTNSLYFTEGESVEDWYKETFKGELLECALARNTQEQHSLEQEKKELLQQMENYEVRQRALEDLKDTLQERLDYHLEQDASLVNVERVYQRKQLAQVFYAWREQTRSLHKLQGRVRRHLFQAWLATSKRSVRAKALAQAFLERGERHQLQMLFAQWRISARKANSVVAVIEPAPMVTPQKQLTGDEEEVWTLARLRTVASAARVPAMMYAASRSGMKDLVLDLINEGAPVNLKDRSSGATPLHAACETGIVETVELLLEAGADAWAVNDAGETALQRLIISMGKQASSVEVAMILLRHDEALLSSLTRDGRSVLHLAIEHGATPQLVSVLLQYKLARVEQQHAKTGETPLHLAAANRNVAHVKLLLEHLRCRAEDFPRDNLDQTPLHSAVAGNAGGGDLALTLDLLIEAGFHVNAFSNLTRQTALHVLCQNASLGGLPSSLPAAALLARFLPAVDLDAKDSKGFTALHYACQHHELRELAVELVRQGASLYLLNYAEESPLDLASPAFAIRLLGSIRFPLFLSRAERDHRHLTRCMVCKDSVNVGFLGRRVADHCRRCGRLCCAKCGAHRSVLKWAVNDLEAGSAPTQEAEEEDKLSSSSSSGNNDGIKKVHKICKHCAEILMEEDVV